MKSPSISIITVVYNGISVLAPTLQSVFDQTYPHIEYIVVDGASKDGTLALIQKYEGRLRYISEPDKGLYDAMNKGLDMATGDFVWFLNAGDYLFDVETVARVAAAITANTDVVYADTLLEDEGRNALGLRSEVTAHKLPKVLTVNSFRWGMNVCHQSFVARRSISPHYNLTYKLTADIDWCIRILKAARTTSRVPGALSRYLVGGVSKQRHNEGLKERFAVLKVHYGFWPTVFVHAGIVVRSVVHKITRFGKPKY